MAAEGQPRSDKEQMRARRMATIFRLQDLAIDDTTLAMACDVNEVSVRTWVETQNGPRTYRSRRAIDNLQTTLDELEARDVNDDQAHGFLLLALSDIYVKACEERGYRSSNANTPLSPIANHDGEQILRQYLEEYFPKQT